MLSANTRQKYYILLINCMAISGTQTVKIKQKFLIYLSHKSHSDRVTAQFNVFFKYLFKNW